MDTDAMQEGAQSVESGTSSRTWWRSECRAEMRSSLAASSALSPGPSRLSLHSAVSSLKCSGALSLQQPHACQCVPALTLVSVGESVMWPSSRQVSMLLVDIMIVVGTLALSGMCRWIDGSSPRSAFLAGKEVVIIVSKVQGFLWVPASAASSTCLLTAAAWWNSMSKT